MRIKVNLFFSNGITLPVAYKYMLQGVIYSAIRKDDKYRKLHNEGYLYGKREYRSFSFSDITGKYSVQGNQITFLNHCEFLVSSPDEGLILAIKRSFEENGITFGDSGADKVTIEFVDVKVEKEKVLIKMLSPICVYTTDGDSKKTKYYNPGDRNFSRLVSENFARKYEAFYRGAPTEEIKLTPCLVLPKHKKIISYKGIICEGWLGQYMLSGPMEYIKFLADAGLGAKNSQGFGLFEVIEEE